MPILVSPESTKLPPLASAADLSLRSADAGANPDADTALEVASGAVRDAAGVPISLTTATVVVNAPQGVLLGLPGPVSAVSSVLVDGTVVTDYLVQPNGLWRRGGWGHEPVPVTVTYTFGLTVVPADIVDLTCQLAISWLNHSGAGGGSTAGLTAVALDDARESYTDEAAGQVSPVFIPKATRGWLAARFGGGVHVVETL